MITRKTLILFTFLNLCTNIFSSSVLDFLFQIEKELSISIIINEKVTDSWSQVTYENCNDTVETLNYLNLLSQEYAKYPKDYFQLAGIKKIVICDMLKFGDQYRASVPDPYSQALFLSIGGQNGKYNPEYFIHVLHHELNHYMEYAIWGSMQYNWKKWKRTNGIFFKYKGNGEMAYFDPATDWYSMIHPRKGFLNLYSMTAQEEDRSELIALIMSDVERKYIFQYYENDRILRKKIRLLTAKLNDFCKSDKNYWQNSIDTLLN